MVPFVSVLLIFCGKKVLVQRDTLLFITEPIAEGESSDVAVLRIQEEFRIRNVKFICDGLLLTRSIPPMGFWYAVRIRSFEQLKLDEELRWVPIRELIKTKSFEYLPWGIRYLLLKA